jgi:hypothetical protein
VVSLRSVNTIMGSHAERGFGSLSDVQEEFIRWSLKCMGSLDFFRFAVPEQKELFIELGLKFLWESVIEREDLDK